MSLVPVTDAKQNNAAMASITRGLSRATKRMTRFIGWQGGGGNYVVFWNPTLRMWSTVYRSRRHDRFVCLFGFKDPTHLNSLSIVCEINPPTRQYDRRTGGLFAKDQTGRIFLAHSGKIGGGRKGIGKSSFIASCEDEQMESVVWPDRKTTQVFVIGRVGNRRLPAQIRGFVAQVDEFKNTLATNTPQKTTVAPRELLTLEFEGRRKGYDITGSIESRCDHGPVINTLKGILQKQYPHVARDRERDLYIISPKGQITHLFEAKTDVSTSSIYCGVGQLMLHRSANSTKRILVLPRLPNDRTRNALAGLGIRVLTYRWKGQTPSFSADFIQTIEDAKRSRFAPFLCPSLDLSNRIL